MKLVCCDTQVIQCYVPNDYCVSVPIFVFHLRSKQTLPSVKQACNLLLRNSRLVLRTRLGIAVQALH